MGEADCNRKQGAGGAASSDLLGPRASRPQVSAKRENELELLSPSERLRAFGAFAGGTPAVPGQSLDACYFQTMRRITNAAQLAHPANVNRALNNFVTKQREHLTLDHQSVRCCERGR